MNTPTDKLKAAPVTWEQLRECIADGNAGRVRAMLEIYRGAQLKHVLKDLAKYRRELRQLERTDGGAAVARRTPLLTAALLCADTPAQAASWLNNRGLTWDLVRQLDVMVELLTSRHETGWIGDLALRLAEKLAPEPDFSYWQFVDALARHARVPVPATPAYIRGWVWMARWRQQGPRAVAGSPNTLVNWLRDQPCIRDYVLAVFDTDGIGADLVPSTRAEPIQDDRWAYALGVLVAEGRIDRGELLDACAARLIRGDRPGSLRGFLALFEELAPSGAEVEERLVSYLSMAASGPAAVAKVALRELRALDTGKPLGARDLAALCESVLLRPEVGLAGAQLAWLDAALRRDQGAAALLLPALGAAFAHPTPSIQQKAINLLAKHVAKADSAVLEALRAAAASLDPALRGDAERLLAPTAPSDTTPTASTPPDHAPAHATIVRPPEFRPSPLPALPQTPGELVTAFAASFTQGELSALEVEQIMAATTIVVHRDRDALADAFRPLADRHANDPFRALDVWQLHSFPTALRCLFQAVLGEDFRIGRRIRIGAERAVDPAPITATLLRIQELTDALLPKQSVPVLLATPTEANGAIDPAVFDERVAAYVSRGIEPLPLDLEHARIRVSPEPSRRTAEDERAIAELLAPETVSGHTMEALGKPRIGAVTSPRSELWEQVRQLPSIRALLYPRLEWDGRVRWPLQDWWASTPHEIHRWPTLLPHDPDQVAAHALGQLFEQARGDNHERTSIFPQLAETAGRPGPLTHLALCYGLAAQHMENRVAAQDALLIFAARGLLCAEWLGGLGAALWQQNMIRGSRLLESLDRAEQAGMPADVFGVTAALIRGTAKRPDTRGLPDLLFLATRCALGAGIHGVEIDGLAELAALTKPKRVTAEAKRLQKALAAMRAA